MSLEEENSINLPKEHIFTWFVIEVLKKLYLKQTVFILFFSYFQMLYFNFIVIIKIVPIMRNCLPLL